MNQVVDIGFKKAKLQDIIETYQDYIDKISNDYDFPDWWVRQQSKYNYHDYDDIVENLNNLWVTPSINSVYLYSLPIKYRLSYIERKVMKAVDDKLDSIIRFHYKFGQVVDNVRSFVKDKFNRDKIVNRLKELIDYECETEVKEEEEDLYGKYY